MLSTPDERAEVETKKIVKTFKEWLTALNDEQEARELRTFRNLVLNDLVDQIGFPADAAQRNPGASIPFAQSKHNGFQRVESLEKRIDLKCADDAFLDPLLR